MANMENGSELGVITPASTTMPMIAQRRHHLTDDLISELIRAEDDGDRPEPEAAHPPPPQRPRWTTSSNGRRPRRNDGDGRSAAR